MTAKIIQLKPTQQEPAPMTTEKKSEIEKVRMIYTGKRSLKGTEMGDAFILESTAIQYHDKPEELDNLESLFSKGKRGTTPLIVGAVYEMGAALNDDRTRAVRLQIESRKGLWDVELDEKLNAAVTLWKIKDAATAEWARAESAGKKLQDNHKAMREIEYLREVYQNTPLHLRHGFELGLMSLIRKRK